MKAIRFLDKALSAVISALAGVMAVGVILTVVLRYVFHLSFNWFEELLTNSFVLMVFLGAALSVRENQHININILFHNWTGKKKLFIDIFDLAVMALVNVFMCIYSIKWIMAIGNTISPASGIPVGVWYVAVPIAAACGVLYCILGIVGFFVPVEPAETGYLDDDELGGEESK